MNTAGNSPRGWIAALLAGAVLGLVALGVYRITRPQRMRLERLPQEPDVIYVSTPQPVVDKMLELAQLKPDDIVYDLGCGDGRIVVSAAQQYGVKAVGVDISPRRVQEARQKVAEAGVEKLVSIEQTDMFKLDLRTATVVMLYLIPELNARLLPQLATMKPGSRIVSHNADVPGAKPVQVLKLDEQGAPLAAGDNVSPGDVHMIYTYVVPWEPEGN